MNMEVVSKIANAILYEGYLLYPYRSSAVKNHQRFNFGVLYPRDYSERQQGSDAWQMQTECLVTGDASTRIEIKVRFLQLIARNDRQEGVEREINMPVCRLESLLEQPFEQRLAFDGPAAEAELEALRVGEGLYRVKLSIRNCATAGSACRDEILLHSLISVHSILHVNDGAFVSLMDPPEQFRQAVADCKNIGAWPVLVGDEGQRDLMLCSPIILYDYPEIAPESPGDLFDGLEIDEILALRILTLTDQEKIEVRSGDERARAILERTEMLPPEHFQKLHGALRGLRPTSEVTR
jgi:hydrogenase maturation protease